MPPHLFNCLSSCELATHFPHRTRWLNYVKAGDTLFSDGEGYLITDVLDNGLTQANGVYLGESISLGRYYIEKAARVETLAEARKAALLKIDSLAGAKRLQYIMQAPGQDATYPCKTG